MANFASAQPTRSTHALSGGLLAAGALLLFVGTLFYARLTPQLGLPAPAADRVQGIADALAFGPRPMWLAGAFAFFGDVLLVAAFVALVTRRKLPRSDLEPFGWTLLAVSAAIAIFFDSMMAVLLSPLANLADHAPFLALNAWFDFLFASGNVPFGLGAMAVLWADVRSDVPLLPKLVDFFGIAVGAAALVSGLGYVTGLVILPLVIGLTVTLGCAVFVPLGIQIARLEGTP